MNTWPTEYFSAQLSKVYTGGLIPQVVLGRNLEVTAHSDNGLLLVSWEGVPETQLPAPIGLMDLGLFLNTLRQAGTHAYVYTDDPRLVVESKENPFTVRLVTGFVDQIPNQVEDNVMESIDMDLQEYPAYKVPAEALVEVLRAMRIISSDTLKLRIDEEKTTFVIGSETENQAEVVVEEIKGESSYELNIPADVFKKVVGVLYDDCDVDFRLSGPNSSIEIVQGTVRHIISDILIDE